MASAEGTDSIELESVFSSKNHDIHSSTLKSSSDDGGKHYTLFKQFNIHNSLESHNTCNINKQKRMRKMCQNEKRLPTILTLAIDRTA